MEPLRDVHVGDAPFVIVVLCLSYCCTLWTRRSWHVLRVMCNFADTCQAGCFALSGSLSSFVQPAFNGASSPRMINVRAGDALRSFLSLRF